MPDLVPLDLAVLLQALGRLSAERVLADLAEHDVRESDGYVFQHLLVGPLPVTALAVRLGITQQAASKAVSDLEARGLVDRVDDPADGRVRLVTLASAGRRAVEAARRSRSALVLELQEALGERRLARFERDVVAVLEEMGGLEELRGRRLRPPT